MKVEAGQVWTNETGIQYTITRIDRHMIFYTFKGNFGEYRREREVYLDTFVREVNEHFGYFLLTDLTKALI